MKKTTKKTKPTTAKPKNIKRSWDKVKPPMPQAQNEDIKYHAYEPKLTNRFIVKFTSGLTDIPAYVVKSIDMPTFIRDDFNELMKSIREEAPSNVWQDIQLSLYDPIAPSTSEVIFKYLKDASEPIHFTIQLFGPVGDLVSEWLVKDCELIGVNFGHLDWSQDNPILLYMTLRPKNCILNF